MGKFVKFTDKGGEWRFNLQTDNGDIKLKSEGYKAEAGCDNGIESVRTNSQDESMFVGVTATNGQLYFNLKAPNGQIIGTSEMYKSASGRDRGKASVKKNAPKATVEKI